VRRVTWITLGFLLGAAVAGGVTTLASRAYAQMSAADNAVLLEILKINQKTYDGLAQMYLGDIERLTALQAIYQAEIDLIEQGKHTEEALLRIYRSQ